MNLQFVSTSIRFYFPLKKHTAHIPTHTAHTLVMLLFLVLVSCQQNVKVEPYKDLTHQSNTFKRDKYYRLYLPQGYGEGSERYPVIYFFHGWGGRYKSDDNAKLEYDMIKSLVDKYNVILVMWDGNMEEKEPRPYNIGNHPDVKYDIQMKDYFLELVAHVDSTYRTIPEKSKRGIIGFSMGGFMSYFLAGKYPDKIGAAVNMTGSPEFFIGYPDNHTLYPLRYMFSNLREVKLRFHNSTADELTSLNTEVHQGALWDGHPGYEYWQFVGGHVVDLPGKTDVFEKAMNFVSNAFKDPIEEPSTWSHYDIYPHFELYNYKVTSDKKEPGFIFLNHVSPYGFGIYTRQWLPDGPPLSTCNMKIVTAPIYPSNTMYNVIKFDRYGKILSKSSQSSDENGSLHITADQKGYEIGIYRKADTFDFICASYLIDKNKRLLRAGKPNEIALTILNRGDTLSTQPVKVSLIPTDSSVIVSPLSVAEGSWSNQRVFRTAPFRIDVSKKPPSNGAPCEVKFNVHIATDDLSFVDEIIVPVLYDVALFNDVIVDDGRHVNDTSGVYGKGNGDGNVSSGEQVMLYTNGHRLRLYTDDPYVEAENEKLVDEVIPAKWPDGFTTSSVIKISGKCPDGHVIEAVGNFETKGYMPIDRKVTWGKVKIQVKNQGME
jgi:enterochelin esterase-like enzyme